VTRNNKAALTLDQTFVMTVEVNSEHDDDSANSSAMMSTSRSNMAVNMAADSSRWQNSVVIVVKVGTRQSRTCPSNVYNPHNIKVNINGFITFCHWDQQCHSRCKNSTNDLKHLMSDDVLKLNAASIFRHCCSQVSCKLLHTTSVLFEPLCIWDILSRFWRRCENVYWL